MPPGVAVATLDSLCDPEVGVFEAGVDDLKVWEMLLLEGFAVSHVGWVGEVVGRHLYGIGGHGRWPGLNRTWL